MKTLHTMKRMLVALLSASMLLTSSALAAGETPGPVEPTEPTGVRETEYLFISQTDASSEELEFQLSEDVFAAVNGADITWTLERLESYANPGEDDEFNPLHDEDEMYPNEQDVIDLENVPKAYTSYLKINNVETGFDEEESAVTLSFDVSPMSSRGNISAPHSNGGVYLDVCGVFELKATADGEDVDLGKDVIVEIKPYASFHTMWEIYADLKELAALGDDDADTAVPYAVHKVMGQSNAGYDMPYLIIAKDSAAVENWLELCDRAETEPEKVIAEIEAGELDYQVPVMYSNIHSNEVAAVDAVLEFARMLMEDEKIDYTKLTGLTDEGQEVLAEQREALGLHIPDLIADKTSYLGAILPEANAARGSQNSGKVEGFDKYYTSEETTIDVDELLDEVFFILVPEENVEGRMYVTRTSSGGYDLNRDNSFQTMSETRNMQHLIATYNPVTLVEFHGQVTAYQFEPCSPPHEPNFEYDLLSEHLMTGGEAMGAAAVANNDDWQSYVIPMRDYLTSDENGDPYWEYPWDDMSTSYTPQFAMLQGCVSYTVEMPAYSESGRIADTFAMVGLSDYVAAEKEGYFLAQLEIYKRCLNNENTDEEVGAWLVDSADVEGAEADLFRPAFDGEGENGQFFPECYIIPLDSEHQVNLQAAYDMIEWLTRNDVKVGITDKAFTYKGETYPAGTMIVSMYQAKRAVANGVLYDGTLIRNWTDLYSEGITAFNYTRGFDQVICAEPAAYETIAAAVGQTLDYESGLAYLKANAKSQITGKLGGDVIISNASEDSTAAVNALLKDGKQVGMITEGEYKGDFICSYKDWLTVADEYILTGTGVLEPELTAYTIEKAPTVYISGTERALTKTSSGYVYSTLVSSAGYNYDRMAMDMLNFTTTKDASKADAVIGATALDNGGLAAVKNGATYVGYTSSAVSTVNKNLIAVGTGRTYGMDCLSTVIYPEETLVNASYIADGDNVMYGYGLYYFTTLPEGAKVLVQRDGGEPMEGFMNGDDDSYNAFINGIMGFSYEGPDMNGNEINITLFANSMTNKAHQRDEYAFISNAIFASLLTDEAYEVAELGSYSGGSGSSSGGSSSGSVSTYSVKIEATENGSVTSNVSKAAKGATVTLTVKADEGFELDNLTVTDTNGKEIAVSEKSGKYAFTMPGSAVTVDAAFAEVEKEPTAPETSFSDVAADAYYAAAVDWAVESGITKGTTDTTFTPNATCTRAQTVTFLWRAAGSPAPKSAENPFTDVAAGAYYYDAVLWAVEQGITKGTTDTTFSPNQTVTRAQTVTFLWRSAGAAAATGTNPFTDVAAGAYYADATLWAVSEGVTNGTTATTFSPDQGCTRAQIVTMLYRYMA